MQLAIIDYIKLRTNMMCLDSNALRPECTRIRSSQLRGCYFHQLRCRST